MGCRGQWAGWAFLPTRADHDPPRRNRARGMEADEVEEELGRMGAAADDNERGRTV